MSKPQEVKFQIIEVGRHEIRPILKNNTELIITNITRIMKEKSVSQEVLAWGICMDQGNLSKMLSLKNRGLTIRVLGRIAKALDVKMYELLK
jgi:DNA-binding Xre family transcriptional regulator